MKYFLLLCLLFGINFIYSQDLTGCWLYTRLNHKYYILKLNKIDSSNYTGISVDRIAGKCSHFLSGEYNSEDKIFTAVDNEKIYATFGHVAAKYKLNYEILDGVEILNGSTYPKGIIGKVLSFGLPMEFGMKYIRVPCDSIKVLEGINDVILDFSENVKKPKDDTLNSVEKEVEYYGEEIIGTHERDSLTSMIESKKTNNSIEIRYDNSNKYVEFIDIELFDYGQDDNDIVGIALNNKIKYRKIAVDKTPKIIKLYLDNLENNQITIFSISDGDIPSNTCEIKFHLNDKQYEYRINVNTNENTVINLKRTE